MAVQDDHMIRNIQDVGRLIAKLLLHEQQPDYRLPENEEDYTEADKLFSTVMKLAEEGKQKVLLLERRNHIAGNCYDRPDDHGIVIHEYGPHIFHTNKEEVYQYLSRFTDWYFFGHEVVANVHGTLIPVPFNLNTLHMVYGKEQADRLEQKLIAAYGEGSRFQL